MQDYTHSTAPNRRFADLVTQRLIKALLAGQPTPYTDDELAAIAANCTLKEDAARKVEREMSKRIAAVAMSHRIGETFDAIVTGVTPNGTFVRVLQPHVEGLLAQGSRASTSATGCASRSSARTSIAATSTSHERKRNRSEVVGWQGLKPGFLLALVARLKPCPDTNPLNYRIRIRRRPQWIYQGTPLVAATPSVPFFSAPPQLHPTRSPRKPICERTAASYSDASS